MSTQDIVVPDIGDFDDIPIIEVLVAEGDEVEAEQSLLTLESDKATMEVPAPSAGTIEKLTVKEGDTVSKGSVIGQLKSTDTDSDDKSKTASSVDQDADADKSQPSESSSESAPRDAESNNDDAKQTSAKASNVENPSGGDHERKPPVPEDPAAQRFDDIPHASPSVRKLARELGVDLHQVSGSGRKGRILTDDVKGYVKGAMQAPGHGPAAQASSGLGVAAMPKIDFSKFGDIETVKLSRIKAISGSNLHRNWVTVPHVTQHDEADITELEAFRKASKPIAEEQGTKLTPIAFLIKAVVAALKKYPQFNASLHESGDQLVMKKYFHIGVAVDTPDGLVVPVIRDCDQKSLLELAGELITLSQKARDKKLSPNEMQGGCFSISSLGGIGGTSFTPIVNAPEVAILGVSRSQMKPVWDGDSFQPRLMLPLSLSYDHRVIDGAAAARFTVYLAQMLSDTRRMLL